MIRHPIRSLVSGAAVLAAGALLPGCAGEFTPTRPRAQAPVAQAPVAQAPVAQTPVAQAPAPAAVSPEPPPPPPPAGTTYVSQPTAVKGCGNPTIRVAAPTGSVTPTQRAVTIPCPYTTRNLEPDEMTPLGFSAREKLAPVVGQQVLPFEWSTATPSQTQLTMQIKQIGPARLLTSQVASCTPVFEVTLEVRLTTADGALAETFTATARTTTQQLDSLGLDHELGADAIARVRAKQPGPPYQRMSAELLFSRYGVAGGLLINEQLLEPGRYIGRWPHSCDRGRFYAAQGTFPIQNAGGGPSLDKVVAGFRGTGALVRVDGSPVTARYQLRGGAHHACFINGVNEVAGLEALVDLEVQVSGGPPLTFPVRLARDLEQGPRPLATRMELTGPCAEPYRTPVQEFAARCGDWGVDLTGYQTARLSFDSYLEEACSPVVIRILAVYCNAAMLQTLADGNLTCPGTSVAAGKGEALLFLTPP